MTPLFHLLLTALCVPVFATNATPAAPQAITAYLEANPHLQTYHVQFTVQNAGISSAEYYKIPVATQGRGGMSFTILLVPATYQVKNTTNPDSYLVDISNNKFFIVPSNAIDTYQISTSYAPHQPLGRAATPLNSNSTTIQSIFIP